MIDKDDGFKFPSDALCFAFAVVLFSNASRRLCRLHEAKLYSISLLPLEKKSPLL